MSKYKKLQKLISKYKTAKGIVNAANAFFEKNNIQGSAGFDMSEGRRPYIAIEDDFFPYEWAYYFSIPEDSPAGRKYYWEASHKSMIIIRELWLVGK